MNPIYLNAAVLPLMATIFIPDAIRDRKSGQYLGLLNRNLLFYFIAIFCVECVLMFAEFGLNLTSIVRATGITFFPFVGAYIFAKYSHKENYGVKWRSDDKK